MKHTRLRYHAGYARADGNTYTLMNTDDACDALNAIERFEAKYGGPSFLIDMDNEEAGDVRSQWEDECPEGW